MKTIEEKAKAYDNAVINGSRLWECGAISRENYEYIFPELKESEDERIRKELLEHCKNQAKPYIQTGNKCPQIQSWIAWLEKQKSSWSEEDEHRLKDTIYFLETAKKHYASTVELDACIDWLKNLKDRVQPQPKQEWCVDDNHEYFSDLLEKDDCDNIDDYAYQCAYCMSHDWIKESPTWDDVERACKLGAEWNEKHHKSAWSEEDKDFMYDTLSNLAELKGRYGEGYGNVGKCIDWLKSIKDRIQPIHEYSDTEKQEMFIRSQRPHFWRPSDEQMDALNDVISSRDIKYDVLSELWKDLNKLRGK